MGGIKKHGKGIQVTFYWNGKRYRPTLKLPPTKKNFSYAERVKAQVELLIATGKINNDAYIEIFPTSNFAIANNSSTKQGVEKKTFNEVSKIWLTSIQNLAAGSKDNYEKMLNFWLDQLGDRAIDEIKYSTILSISNSQGWSGKYRNNMLIPVRKIILNKLKIIINSHFFQA